MPAQTTRRNFLRDIAVITGGTILSPLLQDCANATQDVQPAAPLLNVQNVIIVADDVNADFLDIYASAPDERRRRWFNWRASANNVYTIKSQINFNGLNSRPANPAYVHPLNYYNNDVPLWPVETTVSIPAQSLINRCLFTDSARRADYGGIQNTDGQVRLGVFDPSGLRDNVADVLGLFSRIAGRPYTVWNRSFQSGPIAPDINGIPLHYAADNVLSPCARRAAPITPG